MAPGVGKTYKMLEEGHSLRKQGTDVVIGLLETHGRKETAAKAEGLEIVPRKILEKEGFTLSEMDTEAIIADGDRKVSDLYGMIHPNSLNNLTVRSVFIIDPNKKLRLTITYPASTGRNFNEILRVIDSLQLTDNYQVATPANWTDGGDCVVVPSIPTEEARSKFPKGVEEIKPYLRMTPQPNK